MVNFPRHYCRMHARPYDYVSLMHTTRPRCHGCLAAQSTRSFSSTSVHRSHYKTLGVPRNATKNQIKSSFYKLSKLYHPDVAKDPSAKEKFQAASEAYATLGDDRKRRGYDKTLEQTSTNAYAQRPSGSTHYYPYDTVRRKGATHAWSHTRPSGHPYSRPSSSTYKPGFGSPFEQHPYSRRRHPDPFSSPNVQKATGRKKTDADRTDSDRIREESSIWRAVQVIGIVLLVMTVGGGFRAAA